MIFEEICIQRDKNLGNPSCKKCFPDPSQELLIFAQAHGFSVEKLWAWASAKSFLEGSGIFLQKKVPRYYRFESTLVSAPFLREGGGFLLEENY
ncbi:hypothetical protein Desti_4118 [Desulfomonile tiedjei DSM 6799]|uniref:Uncharacterized protein n=1 Tax=Desulfomonile tiedjei (strain ATCC 49306 / DSM 6799 / DCB-1) TaxID=706587 RepID=I4CB15_DESTA|nr:hypothetical protein Desti_4118 [Desulfomonile tiedjei DSM 6799]